MADVIPHCLKVVNIVLRMLLGLVSCLCPLPPPPNLKGHLPMVIDWTPSTCQVLPGPAHWQADATGNYMLIATVDGKTIM